MIARRVFISYAQESDEHRELVRDLWVFLRGCGIDAKLDWAAAQRRQDWALWMADQIREADVVLCVASQAYRKRSEGREEPDTGKGVQWEARLIRDAFHQAQNDLSRFVPVVLPGQSVDGVPDFLAASTTTVCFVRDFTRLGAEPLLRLLLEQPEVVEPPLGPVPDLGRWAPSPGSSLCHELTIEVEGTDGGVQVRTSLAGTVLGERTGALPAGLDSWDRAASTGRALWAAMFDDATGHRVTTLIDDSPLGGAVDVVVRLGEELTWLPVELLRLPDGRPLATIPGVRLSRQQASVERTATPPLPGPLKILAAVAAPQDTLTKNPPLDVEAEMQALLDAVTDLDLGAPESVAAQVRILEVASLAEITRALADDQYHVLHLSAHSSPDGVELEDEDGAPVFADASGLATALRAGERPLPLVVLSSRRGAESGTAGLAAALVRAGADRVIGMQGSVRDRFAIDLARELYRLLAANAGTPVAQALATARRVATERQAGAPEGADGRRWSVDAPVPTLFRAGADLPLRDPDLPPVGLSKPTAAGGGTGVRELPIGRLIGRRAEVRTAMSVVRGTAVDRFGDVSGVVLTGIGGIGKTAIAGRVLARAREHHWAIAEHDGVWNPSALIDAVAAALPPQPAVTALRDPARQDAEKLGLVFGILKRTPIVLLFDDFEQNLTTDGQFLDPGFAEIFAALCDAAHAGKILATCRYPIPGADDALVRIDVPPLSPAEQGRLFLRLRSLRDLSTEDRLVVTRTIGGHPRLIEFLDVLLRQGSATADLRHVTAKLRALAPADLDPRPGRDLTTGISDAIRLGSRDILLDTLTGHLTPEQFELALQTSLFRAPFNARDLAHTRYGRDPEPTEQTEVDRDVERLRDLSLLTSTPDGELVMHPWVAASLDRHHTDDDRIIRHRRGSVMRSRRLRTLDDIVDFIRHLAGELDFDNAARAAREACEVIRGDFTVAAILADIVPLIPTDHYSYLHLADRECQALEDVGLIDATTKRRHMMRVVVEQRAAADPDDADRRQDLSTVHGRLGDHSVTMGDWDAAEHHYRTGLAIIESLAAADPANPKRRRALCLAHNNLGDLAARNSESGTAERHYRTSLTIMEELAAADPVNAELQRDLGVSLSSLGNLAIKKKDWTTAELHHRACLAIAERLTVTHPVNMQFLHDLGACHDHLGNIAVGKADLTTAERHFRACLAIVEQLAATRPDNTRFQGDLGTVHSNLGTIAAVKGDLTTAEQHWRISLRIGRQVAEADPDNVENQHQLAGMYQRLAFFSQLGRPDTDPPQRP